MLSQWILIYLCRELVTHCRIACLDNASHIASPPPHARKGGGWPTRSQTVRSAGFCVSRLASPPSRGGGGRGGALSLADTGTSVWRQRLPGVEGQLILGERASAGATSARQRTIEYGQELSQLQLFVLRDPLTGPILRLRHPYFFTLRRCSVSSPA